ncbi:MAG: hypothetical protein H0W56_06700 [Acidothermales bacterium]|jgi:hypothetical protein|nr:hypothetical protein [Acidothermales bacterium]
MDMPQAPALPNRVMDLLAAHVPLSLLFDLWGQEPVDSHEAYEAEGVPELAWWHAST